MTETFYTVPGDGRSYRSLPDTYIPNQPTLVKWSEVSMERAKELGVKEFRRVDNTDKYTTVTEWAAPVEENGAMVIRPAATTTDFARMRTDLKAAIRDARKDNEQDGFLLDEHWWDTDLKGRLALKEIESAFALDSSFSTDWAAKDPETREDKWVVMDKVLYNKVVVAAIQHIQGSFAKQKALTEQLAITADADLPTFNAVIEGTYNPAPVEEGNNEEAPA